MATVDDYREPAPPESRAPGRMIAAIIILGLVLLFLVFMYFDQRHKKAEMEKALTEEKDSLARELKGMVAAYDTMKTNNDTLNAGLEKERNRIVKLLSLNASNVQLIKQYKNEISTMRDIMKSYIVQIDSLNTRNKALFAENTDIRQQMEQVRTSNTELSKQTEDLNSKVQLASVVQAKNIVAVPINKKRKETRRISLMDKLRVCFTLRENAVAKPGTKDVYLRVLRPDSLVVTSSADNVFEYKGNKMVYSATRQVEYANQDVDMCIYVDNSGDFVPGNYTVDLFMDDNKIGSSTFLLEKK